MSVGFRTRRSRRAPSDLTIPVSALRALREAHVLADAEFRQRAGRVEFRVNPGADWRPIEEAAEPRPVQLAAPMREEEHP
jgi:hypothetical protein